MTAKVFELVPSANNRKSYGHRATIAEYPDGVTVLYSYSTAVCEIDASGNVKRTWKDWSATTLKHVHDFCKLYDVPSIGGKRDWIDAPVYRSSHPELPFTPRYRATYPAGYNARF